MYFCLRWHPGRAMLRWQDVESSRGTTTDLVTAPCRYAPLEEGRGLVAQLPVVAHTGHE